MSFPSSLDWRTTAEKFVGESVRADSQENNRKGQSKGSLAFISQKRNSTYALYLKFGFYHFRDRSKKDFNGHCLKKLLISKCNEVLYYSFCALNFYSSREEDWMIRMKTREKGCGCVNLLAVVDIYNSSNATTRLINQWAITVYRYIVCLLIQSPGLS